MDAKKKPTVLATIGTGFLVFCLPAFILALNFACNKESCTMWSFLSPLNLFPSQLSDYLDLSSFIMVVSYMLFVAKISSLPFGEEIKGEPLQGGKCLQYKLNGCFTMLVCTAVFFLLWYLNLGVTLIYAKFTQLMATTMLLVFLASIWLYLKSLQVPASQLSEDGNTGVFINDFVFGRELNPRIGDFDLKFFAIRSGLIGWSLVNLAFLAESYDKDEFMNYTLLAVVIFQNTFILTVLSLEKTCLLTIEFVKEGFGFVFAFGATCICTYGYTISTRYLLEHPQQWSNLWMAFFTLLQFTGFVFYRQSNLQKYNFRKNPNDPAFANFDIIKGTGGDLLASGWWGFIRQPHYLGDLLMAFTWSALCGFDACMVYFYPVVLFLMLADRSATDHVKCREVFGEAWDVYCERVKYKLIPYVY